jgi:hypothetical protein
LPEYRPIVITSPGDEPLARRAGIDAVSRVDFLLAGPHAGQSLR